MVNNIIAMFSTAEGMESINVYDLPSAAIVDSIRNNLFWCSWADPGFSGQFEANVLTGSISGWTDWENSYGGTGVQKNPLFVKHIGYEPDQGALDGELQPGSPAINAGENAEGLINWLNATYSLTLQWIDINGIPRDETPTIGAYDYEK
jgi:hypothetical protein